jgi:hypothetical protein
MMARRLAVSAFAVGALLAGCQSTVPGNPQSNGGNPPPPTPSPSASPTGAAAQPLAPQNGYVFITTKSGLTRCQINTATVGCEAQFTNSPQVDGEPANGVQVTADGHLKWILGNLGDIPVVTIDYRTYSAEGWTIVATQDGTRFTNDNTHHGMSVATQGAEAF